MKKSIRRGLILAGLLATPLICHAAESQVLLVQMKDGSNKQFLLESKPVITFNSTICHIQGDAFEADFDMGEIEFAKITTGSKVNEIASNCKVDLTDPNFIKISGLVPGETISLFNTNGMKMLSASTDVDGNAELSIATLPKAIYLLHSNSITFKIYKK